MLMLCPICSCDFELPEESCPACGCGLVPASLDTGSNTDTGVGAEGDVYAGIGADQAVLCRPRLYPVAMLIKQTLEQNGVPALVMGGNAFSIMPHLAFSGELRVLVNSAQLDFARQLYEAYFENDAEIGCDEDQ